MMTLRAKLFGVAGAAGLAASLTLPAFAQSTTTVPANVTVPNSGTQISCHPDGTATVTQNPNATQSTEENVPGTPVTQTDPHGPGTTTSQTPTLQKPATAVTPQCPVTAMPPGMTMPMGTTYPSMPSGSIGNGPAGTGMNALTNNPNGSNWLDKFNRPVSTRPKHHKPSGGGL